MRDARQDPQLEDLLLLQLPNCPDGIPDLALVLDRSVKTVHYRTLWPPAKMAHVKKLGIVEWRGYAAFHIDRPIQGEVLLHCIPDPRGAYVVSETRLGRILTVSKTDRIGVCVGDPHQRKGLDLVFRWAPPCLTIFPTADKGNKPPSWPVVAEAFDYGILVVVNAPVGAEVAVCEYQRA